MKKTIPLFWLLLALPAFPQARMLHAGDFPGASVSEQINACLIKAQGGYGVCDTQGLPNPARLPRTIRIPKGTELDVNGAGAYIHTMIDGSNAIEIEDGGALVCDHQRGYNATFSFAENARVGAWLTNARKDGTQAFVKVTGCTATGNARMKLLDAGVDLQNVYFGTEIHHNTVSCFPGIGLLIQNSKGMGVGPFSIDQFEVNGCALPEARPVVVRCNARGGLISGISFRNSGLEHAGKGQYQVEVDGSGVAGCIIGLTFDNNYSEASAAGDRGVLLKDVQGVQVNTWVFGSGGGDWSDAVTLAETAAGRNANIILNNVICQAPCKTVIRDNPHKAANAKAVPVYLYDR